MAACVLTREQSDNLIQAIERGWTRFFGPPAILQLDDHRGWASDALRTWASDHGTELEIDPGQAHTRLSVVERRHQVLRRGIELFLAQQPEDNMSVPDQIARSLCYVVPQTNNTPNVQGFSAAQWAMGMQPLMDHDLTTAQLTPSEALEQKLNLQNQAAIAVIEADNDAILPQQADPHRLQRCSLRQPTRPDFPRRTAHPPSAPHGHHWPRRWIPPDRLEKLEIAQSGKVKSGRRKSSSFRGIRCSPLRQRVLEADMVTAPSSGGQPHAQAAAHAVHDSSWTPKHCTTSSQNKTYRRLHRQASKLA